MLDKLLPIFETDPALPTLSRNLAFISFLIIIFRALEIILKQLPVNKQIYSSTTLFMTEIAPHFLLGTLFFILLFLLIHFFASFLVAAYEIEKKSAYSLQNEFSHIDKIRIILEDYEQTKEYYEKLDVQLKNRLNSFDHDPEKEELQEINTALSSLERILRKIEEIGKKLTCEMNLLDFNRRLSTYTYRRLLINFITTSLLSGFALFLSCSKGINLLILLLYGSHSQ